MADTSAPLPAVPTGRQPRDRAPDPSAALALYGQLQRDMQLRAGEMDEVEGQYQRYPPESQARLDEEGRGYAANVNTGLARAQVLTCLLYTSPSPRDGILSRMPSSA